jgi:hypothetical protein
LSRDLRIRVRTVGAEQVRTALRGIVREVSQGNAARTRGARQTSAAVVSGARAEERAVVAALQRETTAALRSGSARARAARQASDAGIREARREADGVIREQRRTERRPARRRGGGGGGAGALGAGLMGAANEAVGTVDRYAGAGGVRSREQLLAERADRRQRLIRLRRQMGGSQSIADIDRQIQATAGRTGISQDDLTRGLETAQARFTNAPTVLANLDSLAQVSQTTGASFDDVVGTMGTAQSAFGLNDAEASQFAGMMVDAGNRGSIDAAQLSAAFAPALGSIQRGTQMGGLSGAAQALGLAETIGRGQSTPAEAATMSTRLVESLNDRRTQARLRRAGVNVLDREGNMRPLDEIVSDMAGSRLATDQGLLQRTFTNVEARQGAGIVMSEFARDPEGVASLFAPSAEAGQAYVNETAAEMNADPSARFLRMGIEQEKALVEGGQEVQLMTTMTDLATQMTALTTAYPLATEALGVFTAGLQQAGGLLALGSVLGGGGGGAGGLLGGGLLGGGGAAAGGIGLAGALPLLLGGGAALATIGGFAMEQRKYSLEEQRRASGEAFLAANPSAVTPETLANVTGDASLLSPEARRRGSMTSQARSRDATMAEIMGGESSGARGTVLPSTAFTEAVSEAVARGARQGIEGRERGDGVQRGRRSDGHTR